MKLIPIPKKKKAIRAINQGTRYDISGNLRRLARAIDGGEHGTVANVCVGVAVRANDGAMNVEVFSFGIASVPDANYTVQRMLHRMQTSE